MGILNPKYRLGTNDNIARSIYFVQVRKLNENLKDKEDVLKAEKKLHDLGFVDFIHNLTDGQRNIIYSSPILHFIPWRVVWNTNSIRTPCRPVFDASNPTSSGLSLNHLLAKGKNNMNKLVEIVIRWMIRRCAYHTDLQTMYNRVCLDEMPLCYQLYYFQNELDLKKQPLVKVIKTLIYGVKAERGIRETAN